MRNKLIIIVVSVLAVSVLTACHGAPSLLPRSMKGYELYSWQEQGQWHFTLITGTNRNKTLEEITTGEDEVTEDDWIRLHTVGEEALKKLLDRVPEGEFVIWNAGNFVNPTDQAMQMLIYPSHDLINEITAYADQLGLDFMVPVH
jgi:hypothetical protein